MHSFIGKTRELCTWSIDLQFRIFTQKCEVIQTN